jgi:putative membrane protein
MNQYQVKKENHILKGENKITLFLFIIYLVGVAGISIHFTSAFFAGLIPIIILLSFFTCLIYHKPAFDNTTILVFLAIVVSSFFIEAAAVKYGFIFGNYSYGTSLGFQVIGAPLIIGLNWLLLVYCTAALTENLNQGIIIKVIVASLLMLFYDLLLEISAPFLNMWSFEEGKIPVRNFIAWFAIALFFHSLVKIARVKIINTVAQQVFAIQIIFFILIAIIK